MLSWWLGTVLGAAFPVVLIVFAMMRNRHQGNLLVLAMPGIPLLMICPVLGGLIAIFAPWWAIVLVLLAAVLLLWVAATKSSSQTG